MISRDFFMQVPPDPLDRVTVRAAARQEVQLEPLAVIPQVDHYRLAPVSNSRPAVFALKTRLF
jgi:hypothetical protein